jgi:FixJ family two-component response regulator
MSHRRRVYVVGLDREGRETIARCLSGFGAETWPFASGAEFLDTLDHLPPSCVLIDMDMAGPLGLDVLEETIRRAGWPAIAVTAREDVALAIHAMKLGAVDFIGMPPRRDQLAAALIPAWRALEGMAEAREESRESEELLGRLTARELEVLHALLNGKSNKVVAHDLGISVRTVEMHRANLMSKLRMRNMAEAAVLATRCGAFARREPSRTRSSERSARSAMNG